MITHRQNSHLTHKANAGVGRHGWLRLTPAYSVRLVRDRIRHLPPDALVTDPFSGSGTTVLAAAEHGCDGVALDVNPFLVWLGNVKAAAYPAVLLRGIRDEVAHLTARAAKWAPDAPDLWTPRLHNIGRWWAPEPLAALKCLRRALDEAALPHAALDLLGIAFCRTAIGTSNAAFNHQSMSFKAVAGSVGGGAEPPGRGSEPVPVTAGAFALVLRRFEAEAGEILRSAEVPLPGAGRVIQGDARSFGASGASGGGGLRPCDLLLTSPPYVNRMSYIRELRPYMYWLRFLGQASDAGELDWTAIGGTWGVATSRLNGWAPGRNIRPIEGELDAVRELIERDGGRNGPLLGTYVTKYFHDMADHFRAAFGHVRSGGRVSYIVGNSTFYGHVVPAERWYASLLTDVGFTGVQVTTLRKRNSNLALYEYEVTAERP
jgi:hypothetical protein